MENKNRDIQRFSLNHNWKFHLGDTPDAWKKDFDDRGWQEVRLPHDWSVTLPFSREYSSGTGYAAGGIGWYRLSFSLPESLRGKRLFLTFDGVYKESQVWCNSYYKGFHPNGYTPFTYDITEEAVFGDVNEVCVRVDRTELSDSRWFTGAGITRKVMLTAAEPVRLAEYGLFFHVLHADSRSAQVSVETELCSDLDTETPVTVLHRLLTPGGGAVLELTSEAVLSPGGSCRLECRGSVSDPRLWSPGSPALYTLQTLLLLPGEAPYLADETQVGIRTFSFDPDRGFSLNQVPMKLRGVCVHHDAGALGAAVTPEIWARRLEKLKKMGCNAIRMSHNPHMPELYRLCDSMGFLVIDEAFDEWEGPKNKWSTGHNVYPPRHQGYYRHFPRYHADDLKTMILRDRNHPCVILWSIGNEIDYPNDPYCHPLFQSMTGNNDADKPEEERRYNPARPNAERLASLAAMLAGEVRALDTSHPVTLAAAFPELSSQIGFLDALDVAGYNYKEHLYGESHRRFPQLPFIGSENGHSLAAWRAVTDHDYIGGQFLWTGIDYLGEAHGWPWRASGAGLLTLAGFEKAGYYRRMSLWSCTPMCHLATARAGAAPDELSPVLETWNYLPGEEIEVRCYTNLSEAELFLNGRSLGVRSHDRNRDCLCWTVPFEAGTLRAEAFGTLVPPQEGGLPKFPAAAEASPSEAPGRSLKASDTLETAYAPCALALSVYRPEPSAEALCRVMAPLPLPEPHALAAEYRPSAESCPAPAEDTAPAKSCPAPAEDTASAKPRDGAEPPIVQAEVSVRDSAGRLAVTDASLIHASVEGGELLGIENGDIADCTEYTSPRRRAFHGRLILYIRRRPDCPLTVTVEAEALRSASVTLE